MSVSALKELAERARPRAESFLFSRFFNFRKWGNTPPTDPQILVVAPHADDELLGCGALLLSGMVNTVFYPLHMSTKRRTEALVLAEALGYEARFWDSAEVPSRNTRLVLVPSPLDRHPEHQEALNAALHLTFPGEVQFGEYAVAGRAPYCADTVNAEWHRSKRDLFDAAFPSQKRAGLDDRFFKLEGYSALIGGASVTVTCHEVGFHCWPEAPGDYAYLAAPHRHLFGCRVTVHDLYNEDRQLEYHAIQKTVQEWLHAVLTDESEPDHSCEAMARRIALMARVEFGHRVTVRVDEDGECWSEVTL